MHLGAIYTGGVLLYGSHMYVIRWVILGYHHLKARGKDLS
jgi:hypothetical protein